MMNVDPDLRWDVTIYCDVEGCKESNCQYSIAPTEFDGEGGKCSAEVEATKIFTREGWTVQEVDSPPGAKHYCPAHKPAEATPEPDPKPSLICVNP